VTTQVLDRQGPKAAGAHHVLGGVGAPIVRVAGAGQLVLLPRAGHALVAFRTDTEPAFVLEDKLLGFELGLAFEHGQLEGVDVIQLRGTGAILVEVLGKALALAVTNARPVTTRRDAVVAWLGRVVPRALTPAEAPAGQRGLFTFAGDGTVLVTT
jgi:uncharacterized protein (AIM24 family)